MGDWVVRTDLNRLVREDRSIQVRPQVMHLLVCLAHQPGQVVSRGALLNTIWSDVEIAEEGLTVAISELRRLLGDDARSSHSIETIRKVGYRLVAPVSALSEQEFAAADGNAGADSGSEGPDPQATRNSRPLSHLLLSLLAAALLVGAVWTVLALRSDDGDTGTPQRSAILQGVPLTSYPSSEVYPALSPDGNQVAFAWTDPTHGSLDIYVKQIGREPPFRVTSDPAAEISPAWSPDGSSLAFVKIDRDHAGSTICRVSSLGGEVQDLCVFDTTVQSLDWSPDASWLVFSAPWSAGSDWRILWPLPRR